MNRSKPLDGIRGIAILLVIAGHSWIAYGAGHEKMAWLAAIFANASLGVRLFFVLSGYLITTLLLKELEGSGGISLSRFYARRILRIFPAFYAFLGVIVALAGMGLISVTAWQLGAAATYTWNYLPTWHVPVTEEGAWFLGHLWTLSLEEQFYLFWPATLLCLGWRHSFRLAVVLVALMPVVRIASYYLIPSQRGQLGMMLHTAIGSIMIGCVLALAVQKSGLLSTAARWPWRVLLPAIFAFVFVVSPLLGMIFAGRYVVTLGFTLDAIGAAGLIFYVTVLQPEGGLAALLATPALVFIGRLSYSWYLWQQLFLTQYNRTWSGVFPVSIGCSFIAALASHYLIERPFLRVKKRFSALTQPDAS